MGEANDAIINKNNSDKLICAHCGKEFICNIKGRPPRFCSIVCKDTNYYTLHHPKQIFELVCTYCGNPFNSNNKNTKYCSLNCKLSSYNHTRPVYDKMCSWCGKTFTSRDKAQQCCSPECGRQQAHEKLKKYYICPQCGKHFSKDSAYRMKYCSQACSIIAKYGTVEERIERHKKEREVWLADHLIEKECLICGEPFETFYPNHIYCSSKCSYEANLRLHREQWANEYTPHLFTCRNCGKQVTTTCGNMHSSFCSINCQEKYHSQLYKQLRKTQMKKAFRAPVSFKNIYKRDNGICQICGLSVAFDKSPEKIWSATIDHIIPISRGGTHEPSNCQLTHRICNSIKMVSDNDFYIDWDKKNAEEDGRWTNHLLEYDMMMEQYSKE